MAAVTEVPRVAQVFDAVRRAQPFGLGKGESISVASALVAASDRAFNVSVVRFMSQLA